MDKKEIGKYKEFRKLKRYMEFKFSTLQEFNDHFRDEKSCYDFLENQRWDRVPVCPHCGNEEYYIVKPRGKFKDIPSYRCKNRECDLPFSARTNTIFQGSRVELRKWFQAIYEISTSKKGISSIELSVRIGISQKTAWFMNHRIREMLSDNAPEMLEGVVEVDETFVGGKNKNRHEHKKIKGSQGRSAADKTPVVGLLQRGGKVVTYVTRDTDASTLQWLIRGNVAQEAIVITDGYRSYNGLQQIYDHVKVKDAGNNYVIKRGDHKFHTNNIENFWSQLKRGYIGIYHFMSPKHLHRYCEEFASRYNNRAITNLDRFSLALKHCSGKRITYEKLTESHDEAA